MGYHGLQQGPWVTTHGLPWVTTHGLPWVTTHGLQHGAQGYSESVPRKRKNHTDQCISLQYVRHKNY